MAIARQRIHVPRGGWLRAISGLITGTLWEGGEVDRLERAFADFIGQVAARHGSDPGVLAWSVRNEPAYYDIWRERWGEIATPLLWSHAKYLILCTVTSKND